MGKIVRKPQEGFFDSTVFFLQSAYYADCKKNDLLVVLGDFNAVTGTNRLQGDTVLGEVAFLTRTQNSFSHFAEGKISVLPAHGFGGRIFIAIHGHPMMALPRRLTMC